MPKRERFITKMKCKLCNLEGDAEWEENENPVYSQGLNRKLISLSEGFVKSSKIDNDGDPIILCKKCKCIMRV